MWTHMPQSRSRGQRTTLWSHNSTSNFMWSPQVELKLLQLCEYQLYLLNHLAGPKQNILSWRKTSWKIYLEGLRYYILKLKHYSSYSWHKTNTLLSDKRKHVRSHGEKVVGSDLKKSTDYIVFYRLQMNFPLPYNKTRKSITSNHNEGFLW